ncbi:phospholipid/cholesterol/gamma-HCH transport system substrate-binding protein [Kitasatospora gansuensis]|uniref:Phospholipid/cholesterol/gamma-HCH transport system substrate-binding protein n=1 Tax=Kitasatospora gansuensis TaxID=258050 RepID=A0A7W7SJT9_9ACTN|nr:MCE family protein [Kitasatospora gansuensis]MBB4950636.1 phospholipid/cholesterol/gamma-HCH transport system substrate-binding protein [Kitasatospora gansuensis]
MSPRRSGRLAAGVVFLLVPALLAGVCVAVYDRTFADETTVTLETTAAGNELHVNADVKLRGVVVGRVREVGADGDRARLTLALDPAQLTGIPAGVTAQLLPTTLFGERFVALVPPAAASGDALRAGAVIAQDRSAEAVELEQVLDHLLPLLSAVQPEKLSATLHAVSTALRGRGAQLGTTLVELDSYLAGLNPELPALTRDIGQLVTVSRTYGDAAPELLQALTDLTTTSGTLDRQQAGLRALYAAGSASARDLTDFLQRNRSTLIRLSADSRATLELLAEYAPAFPCTLRTLADFVPVMDKALGKGTDQPGLHVTVSTLPSRGRYQPGKDAPAYTATGGPKCYDTPYTGRGSTPPAATAGEGFPMPAALGLGLPNSPQENALVNELLAPGRDLPDWSSVLAGPLLRGAEVELR